MLRRWIRIFLTLQQVIYTLRMIKLESNHHIYSRLIQIYIKISSSQKENQNPIGLLDEMETDRIVLTIFVSCDVLLFSFYSHSSSRTI
jgi:hypothetical protein